MARYNVTNRTTSLRGFASADRYLRLAGGESERNVELTDEGATALEATNEFDVVKLESQAPAAASKPADEDE